MKHDLGNLTFLLTIGAMPLACAAEDTGEANDTTASTTAPSTGNPSTTDADTGTSDDPSTTDPDGGSTGETPEACAAYVQHYVDCFPGYDGAAAAHYCATYFGYAAEYGAGCIAALEEVYACLAMVDCAAWEREGTPICEAEYTAASAACPWDDDTTGGDASSSSSDGGSSGNDDGASSSSSG